MSQHENRLPLAARTVFVTALILFVATIVIGILNGADLYEPDHDTLIGHVHAGTLGWITLAVAGTSFLVWGGTGATAIARALSGAVTLYVAAFFAGDAIPGDRIARPIAGTLLLLVVIWFLAWVTRANRTATGSSAARIGLILAWWSMLIGAVFGIVLGIAISRGEVPGLSDKVADSIAEAHPPAMVIGFLLLAAMSLIEWLIGGGKTGRSGSIQMWLTFVAGVLVNIGFITGREEEIVGLANLLMIVAVVMLVWRHRAMLTPASWKGAGTGAFPRIGVAFLVVYLGLITALVIQITNGSLDVDALTEAQEGLILTFDHVMFIGVMTNLLFGVLAVRLHGASNSAVDRILLWGVNVGIAGFATGLIFLNAPIKRVFTPLMGTALLVGIVGYLIELRREGAAA